jgi:integrase/recombinase XerC
MSARFKTSAGQPHLTLLRSSIEETCVPWQRSIMEWTISLRAAGRSEATIVLYRHYLNHLADRLPQPWTVTTRDLEHALGTVTWGPGARKSLRTAMGGFYRWGARSGYIDHDPAAGLPTVRVPRGRPRPAPEGVIVDALARADDREGLMVELGALAGLRAGEIARVHTLDLAGDLLLVHGKGGKERVVPLAQGSLIAAIEAADGWLFPNGRGSHLTPNHVSKLLSRLLPAPWTAHTLRHRFGTRAYAGTRDLLAVSKLLGHASTDTTLIYVLMPEDHLRLAVRAASVIGAASLPPPPRAHISDLAA